MAMTEDHFDLPAWKKAGLVCTSFLIVAFGQPAWSEWLALASSLFGFACFWRVLLAIPNPKRRFLLSFCWFGSIQLVQLSWMASHPYFYIYAVIAICAAIMGLQWGLVGLLMEKRLLKHFRFVLALAGLWTILEWSRLFILSGLPFNPIGLALSGSMYSMQLASYGGIYALSFWVMAANLLLLRSWVMPFEWKRWAGAAAVSFAPFLLGFFQIYYHQAGMRESPKLSVLLVQPALPIEENLHFQSADEARKFVLDEWRQTFFAMQDKTKERIDLVVLPEYLVPYGTFHPIFPFREVQQLFSDGFGVDSTVSLNPAGPFVARIPPDDLVLASNAYIAQELADLFHAHLIVGLEDSTYFEGTGTKKEAFSSAFHFVPGQWQKPARYEKRVLVPMGEYIPFEWCRQLAAGYGITGSFACGTQSKVFPGPVPLGISICYEEIYGHLMRESRQEGAEMLVNLTNDGWFPYSRLPKQHFDHARLRTVENGIPLVRACNTGITGAVDSLGRMIGVLGDDHMLMQDKSGSLLLDVPLYHYRTVYSKFGNVPILALSAFLILFALLKRREL